MALPERDPVLDELVELDILTPEELAEAETTIRENLAAGQDALAGTRFELDLNSYRFSAAKYPQGETLFSTQLPKPGDAGPIRADDWENTGTHITLLHPENHKKVEDIAWSLTPQIAFVKNQRGIFLEGDFINEANLAISDRFTFPAFPKQALNAQPLDIAIAPSQTLILISDRGAGQVHIVSLEDGQLRKTINHRNPGGTKAMNMAIAEKAGKVYIADNSSAISVYGLADDSNSKINPKGLMGNLILSPDESTLFVMTTKPTPEIKVIDTSSGDVTKTVAIKGDLFSVKSDFPTDLMQLSGDQSHFMFMTFLNDPEPFTPVISVVNIAKRKTTARFAIKDGSRPTHLTIMGMNPLSAKNQSVLELLLSQEIVTNQDIGEARVSLRQKELEAQEAALQDPSSLMDMDQVAFEEAQKEPEETISDEGQEEGEEGGKFKPEKAPHKNISPVAEQLIAEHCMDIMWTATKGEIDMKGDPDLSEGVARLKSAASKARNELEWHNGAIIKLKELVGEMNFETVIMRDQVEDWLHKHERDQLVKDGLKTVPSNCPNCNKPLMGSYICSFCGYEIERPEELLKRGLISISTVGSLDNLPAGHYLLIDIEGKRLLEVDQDRNIVWTIGKDVLSDTSIELEFPRDAVRLATRNTLITDYSLNSVVEVTPSGRRFWVYDNKKSPDHQLKNPVRSTANGLNMVLIVDQGRHRILEVDKDSDIRYQYGEMDKPGIGYDKLNMPSDVQRLPNGNLLITDMGNHRVIEVEEREIVWQYGNDDDVEGGGYGSEEGQLCYPQSAFRTNDGHTLIVDTGNLRIIELDEEDNIVWEHKTNEGPEEHQLDSPFRAAKTPNNQVMVLSESAIIEVSHSTKEITWAAQLSEFEKAKLQVVVHEKSKRFVKHGVKNPYMRFKEAKDSDKAQDRMKELIAKRMASARPAGTNKAHVSTLGGATLESLEPLDFFMVERNKNRILRVNRKGEITWRYGEEEKQMLDKPHCCTKTKTGTILVADTDLHRIIEIDPKKSKILWHFGVDGKPGKGTMGLNRPRFVTRLDNHNLLIADQNNRRVFELSPDKNIDWIYEGMDKMMAPYAAQKLANGNYLIVDWGGHIVFEVNPAGEIVWQFGEMKKSGSGESGLSYPEHATRLGNGHTLITDTRNHRVIEVDSNGKITWEISGHGKVKFGSPTFAKRDAQGHTLILHSSNRQMVEVNAAGDQVWKLMLPFDRPSAGITK